MTRRKTLALRSLGAIGLVAIAAPVAWLGLGRRPQVPVAVAEKGRFVRKVVAEGVLKAAEATPLVAPLEAEGGLKIAWLLADGSRVRQGDLVVRFDPTELEKQLADSESDRAAAESKIAGARAASEGELENLGRDERLARQELDLADRFEAKDPLIFSKREIIESEVDRDLASVRLDHAEKVREEKERLSKVGRDLLEIERRKAELGIAHARKALSSLEIRAPHDGVVVYRRDWRQTLPKIGDTVWSGEALGEMPRPDVLEAEVFVLEADAGGLAPGQPAEVEVDSAPGTIYRAKVKNVDRLARPRVPWIPVQYFRATIELEKTDPRTMKPGQRVVATLVLDERESALTVPRSAVFEKDGKKIVYRREGRGFEPVEIVPGPVALGRIVIEKGISEGDWVALQDPTRPLEEAAAGPASLEAASPGRPAGGVAP